ncbi:MAG: hypothetical protein EOM55_05385, partial [Clostridia bacterium]|nr:hypothetical protein [Clostridia bacterium]
MLNEIERAKKIEKASTYLKEIEETLAHLKQNADLDEIVKYVNALKTIEDEFKEEYQKGLIVFMDINGDLEENQEIVEKYRARGSSLF